MCINSLPSSSWLCLFRCQALKLDGKRFNTSKCPLGPTSFCPGTCGTTLLDWKALTCQSVNSLGPFSGKDFDKWGQAMKFIDDLALTLVGAVHFYFMEMRVEVWEKLQCWYLLHTAFWGMGRALVPRVERLNSTSWTTRRLLGLPVSCWESCQRHFTPWTGMMGEDLKERMKSSSRTFMKIFWTLSPRICEICLTMG